jgi:hypothetical protein
MKPNGYRIALVLHEHLTLSKHNEGRQQEVIELGHDLAELFCNGPKDARKFFDILYGVKYETDELK